MKEFKAAPEQFPVSTLQHPMTFLEKWAKERGSKVYMQQPVHGSWDEFTFARALAEVQRVAGYLRSLKLPEDTKIAIVSKNCAQWQLADFAIWYAGYVSVPIFPNLEVHEMNKILEHSEARIAFVGKLDHFEKIDQGLTKNCLKLYFPYDVPPGDKASSWNEICKSATALTKPVLKPMKEIATLIYTSGTTGNPKGVIHTFESLMYAGMNLSVDATAREEDRFFSYLPLSHVAERALCELLPLIVGATVGFAESLQTFQKDLQHIRPTLFLGVPRIWEKFQEGILKKLPQKKLDTLLSIPLVSSLIRKKILKGLGLDRVRLCAVGAAPARPALFIWYEKLGLEIANYYGMTENLCYSHRGQKGPARRTTVGTVQRGVTQRFADDGELQVKSPATMSGYYKNPEATAEALRDGFLCTGDKAEIDADGNVRITGRTKDIFKTAKGKYIFPSEIEKSFAAAPYMEQICVVGAGMTQPFLIGTASPLINEVDVQMMKQELKEKLDSLNSSLHAHERLSHIVIVKEPWTVENGVMTPTLKIKRHVIETKYSGNFADWTASNDAVLVV